jgi:hypothetical protein
MRRIAVRVTLAMLAFVAALYLPTQRAGAAEAEKFDLEKAITGAKTPADHEAIASYYDREVATAKAKAEEHRKLAEAYKNIGRGRAPMGGHCLRLAQNYESVVAENAALAEVHREMARKAAQKKP